MSEQQQPGWYPDPSGAGERWWNGVSWGEARAAGQTPSVDPTQQQAPPPSYGEPPPAPPGYQTGYQQGYQQPPPPPGYQPYQQQYAQQPYAQPAVDERQWRLWSHLGPLLAGIVVGLISGGTLWVLAFVVPLVIMTSVGNRSPRVRAEAVESLNFQLSWLIYGLVFIVVAIIIAVVTLGFGLLIIFPAGLVLGLVWLVLNIIGCVNANNDPQYRYPLTIRMVS